LKDLNEVSGVIVDAAIRVHSALGPGLLESTYTTCLAYELREQGLPVRTQVPLPVVYKTIRMPIGYRIDLDWAFSSIFTSRGCATESSGA
jgi:GxxExxY protein